MPGALLAAWERAVWSACFVGVAAALVLTGFSSADGDSSLYASIAERLAQEPVTRWIAPEWWGFWPDAGMTGLFRECPAGIFLLPAALARIGVPAAQGAYVVGVAAGLASLLLIGVLVHRLASRADARAALVLLQLMPVAFIFRIRGNHEYPMLVCLLVTLIGLDGVRRSWRWLPLVALGFTAGLLIKGVFVAFILLAAALWILVNPMRAAGAARRQIAAYVIGVAVMAAVAVAYDATYLRVTGETFWIPYWQRQIGQVTFASPLDDVRAIATHVVFYIWRLLWHPAPWSLMLVWALWRQTRMSGRVTESGRRERRALVFVLGFATLTILALSLSSRFAERYAFSATFMIAACGAVAANRVSPAIRGLLSRLDAAVPAMPALLWLTLAVLRLVLGPLLPRIQM